MTRLFTSLTDPELATMIQGGAIGVLATDTVYGLVSQATNEPALKRFYQAKPRHNEPGTIIGASTQQFATLGFSLADLEKSQIYWPGSISVVLNAARVAPYLRHHRDTLPLRIPALANLQELLQATGALMTTSANTPGEPTAKTIGEARYYFGETVDFYVDSGTVDNPASTIIGFDSAGTLMVYRHGAVHID